MIIQSTMISLNTICYKSSEILAIVSNSVRGNNNNIIALPILILLTTGGSHHCVVEPTMAFLFPNKLLGIKHFL